MRVLLTTDTVGGVWTLTRELSRELLVRGNDVALVSFGRFAAPDQRRWVDTMHRRHGSHFMFRESDVPLEWMQNNAGAFDGGVELLSSTATDFDAEILHSNQFCWGAVPLRLRRIITAHSDVLSWAAACAPEGLHQSPWLDLYCAFVQAGLDAADAVVSPTQWMQQALQQNFALPSTRRVIRNGRSLPTAKGSGPRRLQAVSVGRLWDEAKGLATLLNIDSPLPIVLAGEETFDGATTCLSHIESRGVLDETSLLQLFRESSIYIATSIYEPFGLAPLEAALCGCAIIARDIPSLREVWGNAALFFSTSAELVHLLQLCTSCPRVLHDAQELAQEYAQTLSAERMAIEYINLYASVLSKNSSTHAAQEIATHAA